jgi:hypothetical protein
MGQKQILGKAANKTVLKYFVCLRPVSCVPNVTSFSGLSSSCVLCSQCYYFLWIVFFLCLEETVGTIKNGQSRDTGNINKCERKLGTIKNGQSRG